MMKKNILDKYKVQIGKWKGYKCPECGELHTHLIHLEADLLGHKKAVEKKTILPEDGKIENKKTLKMDKYKTWDF